MQRTKDLRDAPTQQEADQAMARIARAEARIETAKARANQRIADIKATLQDAVADLVAQIRPDADIITRHVEANPDAFSRPRKRRIECGSYGLEKVTDLLISDQDALIEHLMDLGYDDCVKITRAPVKPAIRARIAEGEAFPGATIRSGDTVVYKTDPQLIWDARARARRTAHERAHERPTGEHTCPASSPPRSPAPRSP